MNARASSSRSSPSSRSPASSSCSRASRRCSSSRRCSRSKMHPRPRPRRSSRSALTVGITPIALRAGASQQIPLDVLALRRPDGQGAARRPRLRVRARRAVRRAVQAAGSLLDTLIGFSFGSLVDPITGTQSARPRAALRAVRRRWSSSRSTATPGSSQGLARTLRARCRCVDAPEHRRARRRRAQVAFAGIFAAAHRDRARRCCSRSCSPTPRFGIVSRVVPQLNVFAVGFPAKITVGLVAHRRLAAVRRRLARRRAPALGRRRAPRAAGGVLDGRATRPRRQHRRSAKRRARRARSPSPPDLNGAVVLLAALLALSAFGPAHDRAHGGAAMRSVLHLVATPERRQPRGHRRAVHATFGEHVARSAAPRSSPSARSPASVANVAQVGFKPHARGDQARRSSKLNPLTGFKNLFSPQLGRRDRQDARQGRRRRRDRRARRCSPSSTSSPRWSACPPADAAADARHDRPARSPSAPRSPTSLIGVVDFVWQRYRHEKSLKMDKQEVKEESKQQELPPRSRWPSAAARCELARARMMDAVPTADVVVTNPTHYSVALATTARQPAPIVVAKGTDHLALRDPRRRRRARRRGRARPAARPHAVRQRRDRPHDPRGALPRRRAAPRLRLPRRRRATDGPPHELC